MNSAYLHSVDEVLGELRSLGYFPDCSNLSTDSRQLTAQDVFLAIPGEKFDPRTVADDLIARGQCGVVLVEYDDARSYVSKDVLPVLHLKEMLAELAAAYYENPSHGLRVLAVTGTNGKTTVTRWLAQALNAMGEKAGVIGTLGFGLPESLQFHSGLTTPDPINLQRTLYRMKSQDFKWVCIEASSIGLEQGRLNHVRIELAAYTNFSRDHLDYHSTMEEYEQAKLILARWVGLKHAVVNADDPCAETFGLVAQTCGATLVRVGRLSSPDFCIRSVAHSPKGLDVEIFSQSTGSLNLSAPVVGVFNADNLALTFAGLVSLGFNAQKVAQALKQVSPAPGRMQKVSNQPCVVVDYAHTSDALEKALQALRPVAQESQGLLWVVFGCGGDRDKGKRPLMTSVAEQLADRLVITSDNPRSEDPAMIVKDMLKGLTAQGTDGVHIELDRKKAIEWCLANAAAHDVVLLAGKGHETTQTIGVQVFEHSDVDYANHVLTEMRHV